MCTFDFVSEPDPKAVNLRLFEDRGYRICGEVTGPIVGDLCPDRCIADAKTAYWAAIRIANSLDVEVVVLGDPSLWLDEWGTLVAPGGRELSTWNLTGLPRDDGNMLMAR